MGLWTAKYNTMIITSACQSYSLPLALPLTASALGPQPRAAYLLFEASRFARDRFILARAAISPAPSRISLQRSSNDRSDHPSREAPMTKTGVPCAPYRSGCWESRTTKSRSGGLHAMPCWTPLSPSSSSTTRYSEPEGS